MSGLLSASLFSLARPFALTSGRAVLFWSGLFCVWVSTTSCHLCVHHCKDSSVINIERLAQRVEHLRCRQPPRGRCTVDLRAPRAASWEINPTFPDPESRPRNSLKSPHNSREWLPGRRGVAAVWLRRRPGSGSRPELFWPWPAKGAASAPLKPPRASGSTLRPMGDGVRWLKPDP